VGDGRNVLRERDGVANIAKLAAAKPLDAHHRDGWLDERELEVRDSPSAQFRYLPKQRYPPNMAAYRQIIELRKKLFPSL